MKVVHWFVLFTSLFCMFYPVASAFPPVSDPFLLDPSLRAFSSPPIFGRSYSTHPDAGTAEIGPWLVGTKWSGTFCPSCFDAFAAVFTSRPPYYDFASGQALILHVDCAMPVRVDFSYKVYFGTLAVYLDEHSPYDHFSADGTNDVWVDGSIALPDGSGEVWFNGSENANFMLRNVSVAVDPDCSGYSVASVPLPGGTVSAGTANLPLYGVRVSAVGCGAHLHLLSLSTSGTYLLSDIEKFRLWYSADDTLDSSSDAWLRDVRAVPSGGDLQLYADRGIHKGVVGYFFVTADISSLAGGGRDISMSVPSLSKVEFRVPWAVKGTLLPGGSKTFDSSEVTIKPHPVSEGIAAQGTSGYLLYGLKLSISDKSDAVLTGLNLTTRGNYQSTDIAGFTLRYSEDEILDPDDPSLATHVAVGPGGTLAFAFTGESEKKNLPAGSTGYLFVTADIADKVNSDLTISVASINFDDIQFQIDPVKVGTPLPAGETHTLYAPPVITISTPQVAAAQVAQGTGDHVLYQITLSVADNDVILNDLTMTPQGTYTASDIDRFRLYASADGTFNASDTMLAETDVVSPGENLDFPEFSKTMNNGETIHLFVTADINEDAEGTNNVYMELLNPGSLIYDDANALIEPQEPLLTGGAQTFPLSPYIAMGAGFYHTLGLKKNGTVWAWGSNENGQLGDGTTEDSVIALPVLGLTQIEELAAGDFFSLALKQDGTVWAYGQNDFGQLGDGTAEDRAEAVQVSGLTNILDIAAGDAHSVALRDDGTVWSWGANRYGQLGDGTTQDSLTPLRVSGLDNVIAVAASGGWTMALKSDKTVWAWGQNDLDQLGDGTAVNQNTPVQISGLTGVEAIAAGDYHGLALRSGSVFAWGSDENGQLGSATTTTPVSGLTNVTAIAAGNRHSLALLGDGTVRAWGWNKYGQLGDGTETDRDQPVRVSGLSGVTGVEAGGDFSLAIKTDGTIRAFGHNYYGQLGDGTSDDRNTPVQGGIIPLIRVTAPAVPPGVVTRGGEDQILYRIRLDVTDADATLTGLTLTTGGDYEASDIAEQGFTLRYSEDETPDPGDSVLDTSEVVPPSGYLRFDGFSRPMEKGTTGYLLITVNMGANPVPERTLFIKNTPLEQVRFEERNVFKSGVEDPLPAGGEQSFPIITVNIESPAVSSSEVQQNTENVTLCRLNLSKTDGPEDATLDGLFLTPGGTYLPSDIAGSFKLYYSGDDSLDPATDRLISTSSTVPPGGEIEFTEIGQTISSATTYLFVTADISATAGGARTLSIAEIGFSDIRFAQNFLAKTGENPTGAGGTITFPISEITATGTAAPGTTEQSADDHILYHTELSVRDADTTLTGLTLTVDGTYEPSDINGFRLYYSEDGQLNTETDPLMAEHDAVPRGEPIMFDLSRMLRKGTGHIFLTVEIGDYAVARTIFVTETPLENLFFADDVRFEPADALAAGGVQTFPTPAVAVSSPAVPAVTVEQETWNHPLYQISLAASDARAILTDAAFTTAGTYQVSDIDRFTLRYSEDATLDDGDNEIGSYQVSPPGSEMVFENISQTIEKGTTGHIFLTADIGAANGARTVSITETALDRLGFREPENMNISGTMTAGAVQTFPVPLIAVSSPPVSAAEIEQDIPNLILYKVKLDVSRAEAVLHSATFTTQGTCLASDLDGENPFELRYSNDEFLDDQDSLLGTKPFVSPGMPLSFTGQSRTIDKESPGYLFLTADIGRANGARTLSVQAPELSQFAFEFGDKTGTMIAGGVQTFPVPSITITAPEIRAAEVAQETPDHILYRLNLAVTRAEAVLKSLTLKTRGTYLASDLMPETPFKLRYSDNDTLSSGDAVLGTGGFVGPGNDLSFTGLSRMIDKNTTGYLFVTADIGEAVGRHIFVSEISPGNITFEFGDKIGPSGTTTDNALKFDGNDDYVEIGDESAFDFTDRMTVEAWIKVGTFDKHWQAIVTKGDNSWRLHRSGDSNNIGFGTDGLASEVKDIRGNVNVNDGQWHHIAAVYDGSSRYLYCDGELDTSGPTSGEIDDTDYPVMLGENAQQKGRHFNGWIDEVRIWNIARTQQQIKASMNLTLTGNESGLTAYYSFDHTSGNILKDLAGDHDGTLHGDPSWVQSGVPGAGIGAGRQQFPVPRIIITSPAVESSTVEPGTTDLLLYSVNLNVTKAAAILESLTLTPAGTYRNSDIRTSCSEMETCTPDVERELAVFKLRYSKDNLLGESDPLIRETLFVPPGGTLAFTNLSTTIPRGNAGYLFVTANVGPSVGGRTIRISQTPFENMAFGYREKTDADPAVEKIGQSPLAQGDVQTFAEVFGNLIELDGIEDYLEVPHAGELNPSRFTVSVRANVGRQEDADGNPIMTRQTLVSSIDEDAHQGYEIFVDTDNLLKFRVGTGSGWKVLDGPEIITHQFYDITGTYNGNGMSFFVDDRFYGENVGTGFSPNPSDPLRIGSQPDGDFYFDGQIRELHIWNIPRTESEIRADIEKSPTDDETGIVAHYRFAPWGTLADSTGSDYDGTIFGKPAWASVLSGLWIGQIEISQVNETGFGTADTETPRDVRSPFDMRILLHVDAGENVSLLRHVTLMQKVDEIEKDDGTTEERGRRVLVTDDNRLHEYEGVVRRDGKLVGIRLGTLFFDFDPSLNKLPVDGKIREGASLTGALTLSADHPNNPFRHLYHPDLRSGREVNRHFTLTIATDEEAELDEPKAGVLELNGVYEESIYGLVYNKKPGDNDDIDIGIRMKGTFRLERVSVIPLLNE